MSALNVEDAKAPVDAVGIVVVIVTYGRRLDILRRTVEGLDNARLVTQIIVVDNGSADAVSAAELSARHPITVIRMNANVGSAGGFARGIEAALQVDGATFLAILDDDNLGEDGFLDTLAVLHREYGGGDNVAFAALRADRPHLRALLERPGQIQHRTNSFLGFHILDVPARLWRRIVGERVVKDGGVRIRPIQVAPYGGLFLTLATAKRIGLPRADFVLYGDDHEYTRRFANAGVTLYLTDLARIADIDQSWNLERSRGSQWINNGRPAWRIYYAARNHVFLEQSDHGVWRSVHRLNGWALSMRLLLEALVQYRSLGRALEALAPFREAVADARRGALGTRSHYRLPGAGGGEAADGVRIN